MTKISIVEPLTYKHTANWRRAIEKRRPDATTFQELAALPTDYLIEVAIDSAFEAGWFLPDVTQEQVEAQTPKQAGALANAIMLAYRDAYSADPN